MNHYQTTVNLGRPKNGPIARRVWHDTVNTHGGGIYTTAQLAECAVVSEDVNALPGGQLPSVMLPLHVLLSSTQLVFFLDI